MQLMFTLLDYYVMLIVPIYWFVFTTKPHYKKYVLYCLWCILQQKTVYNFTSMTCTLVAHCCYNCCIHSSSTFLYFALFIFFLLSSSLTDWAPHLIFHVDTEIQSISVTFWKKCFKQQWTTYIFSWTDNSIHFFPFLIYSRLLRVQ